MIIDWQSSLYAGDSYIKGVTSWAVTLGAVPPTTIQPLNNNAFFIVLGG